MWTRPNGQAQFVACNYCIGTHAGKGHGPKVGLPDPLSFRYMSDVMYTLAKNFIVRFKRTVANSSLPVSRAYFSPFAIQGDTLLKRFAMPLRTTRARRNPILCSFLGVALTFGLLALVPHFTESPLDTPVVQTASAAGLNSIWSPTVRL